MFSVCITIDLHRRGGGELPAPILIGATYFRVFSDAATSAHEGLKLATTTVFAKRLDSSSNASLRRRVSLDSRYGT